MMAFPFLGIASHSFPFGAVVQVRINIAGQGRKCCYGDILTDKLGKFAHDLPASF
uniref:Uncharacterized protein n=1 Tax=Anguilla anguilla TaxID=7936 RepID=A0A0E9UMW2_ANGAN